jgi:hypothetical protein
MAGAGAYTLSAHNELPSIQGALLEFIRSGLFTVNNLIYIGLIGPLSVLEIF